jgi:hypothetical protein
MPVINANSNSNYLLPRKLWCRAAVSVVIMMAGSTTGVPISPGYGGHQQQHTQQPLTTLGPASAKPPRL